jgi:SAM-dependent methyltransferase
MRRCVELPKITVVTPNLNGGATLRRTIESIVQQEYPNLEYIIVDGGSRDDSRRILAQFAPHIDCLVCGKDRNLYDAIAKGFDLATGDVLAWLNSDDMYEPGVLLRIGQHFARHPRWNVVYLDGTVWKQGWRVPNRPQSRVGYPELLRGHVLYQDSVFFRRRAYEAVGGLDRTTFRLAGDYHLWLKLAARYSLHFVPESGSCFRKRPEQLSGDWDAYVGEMAVARQLALQRLPRFFGARSAPGLLVRKVARRIDRRRRQRIYNLPNELVDWPTVTEAPPQPLAACRCPVCGRPPDRLLFSTPDTRFGDRTVRSLYFCSRCRTAFVFPRPDEAELAALYERTYSGELPAAGETPPGTLSPYRVPSLLKSSRVYHLMGYAPRLLRPLGLRSEDIVPVEEPANAQILEVGCFEGRVLDGLRQRGYTNLHGCDVNRKACETAAAKGYPILVGDITQTDWPGRPFDAIILNQLIEHVADPIALLAGLRGRLVEGGRIYLSTPNLDSVWLRHYGPCWSHWHVPFHQVITSPHGLRKMARRTGYAVRWVRTNTPTPWVYLSDLLAERGLGGFVSHHYPQSDRDLGKRAGGATVLSWLVHDWRKHGDCMHACLVNEGTAA